MGILPSVTRLLDKGLIVSTGMADNQAAFRWTQLGYVVARNLDSLAPRIDVPKSDDDQSDEATKKAD